ncbi:MAG: hypothetical protein K2N28_03850 [Muribaculaceae bacterium]|nr:hypothetical protein [Muribaculaceae bacterium]
MDLDDLKRTWQSQNERIDKLEEQNQRLRERMRRNSLSGHREKLLNTYLIFIITTVVMIPFSLLVLPEICIDGIITYMLAAYFVVMGVANAWVWSLIRRIDPANQTVCENLQRVVNVQSTRRVIKICSIPLVLVTMGVLLYHLRPIEGCLEGGIAGGIVGGIVGYRQDCKIRKMLREMRADLEDALSEN